MLHTWLNALLLSSWAHNFDQGSLYFPFALGFAYYVVQTSGPRGRGSAIWELQANPCANQSWLACPFHMSAMSCQPFSLLWFIYLFSIYLLATFCTLGTSFRCWIYPSTLDLGQRPRSNEKYQSKQTKSVPSWSSHSLERDSRGDSVECCGGQYRNGMYL